MTAIAEINTKLNLRPRLERVQSDGHQDAPFWLRFENGSVVALHNIASPAAVKRALMKSLIKTEFPPTGEWYEVTDLLIDAALATEAEEKARKEKS